MSCRGASRALDSDDNDNGRCVYANARCLKLAAERATTASDSFNQQTIDSPVSRFTWLNAHCDYFGDQNASSDSTLLSTNAKRRVSARDVDMIASAFAAALSINPRSGGEYQRWRNLHNAELDASDYAEARAGGGILVVLPARSLLLSSRFSLLTASTIHSAHPPINRQSERRSSRQKCGCETTRNEQQNRQFPMFASIYRSAEIGAVQRSHSTSDFPPSHLPLPLSCALAKGASKMVCSRLVYSRAGKLAFSRPPACLQILFAAVTFLASLCKPLHRSCFAFAPLPVFNDSLSSVV